MYIGLYSNVVSEILLLINNERFEVVSNADDFKFKKDEFYIVFDKDKGRAFTDGFEIEFTILDMKLNFDKLIEIEEEDLYPIFNLKSIKYVGR